MGEAKRRKQHDPNFGKAADPRLKIFEPNSAEHNAAYSEAVRVLGATAMQNLTGSLFYLFSVENESGASFLGYAHPFVAKDKSIRVDLILLTSDPTLKHQIQNWWAKVEKAVAKAISQRAKDDMDTSDVVIVKGGAA